MTALNDLSIVIPVGPEDDAWHHLLKELADFGQEPEIILSACRQQPADTELPGHAHWFCAAQGRAHQLNNGASQSARGYIWFVHADTRFTPGVMEAVQHFIEADGQGLGYFRLMFADDGPGLTRLNASAANFRSRCFGLPFGDQGFIVRKSVFRQMNGFDESVALGEDLDFVVRLQAAGIPLHELPAELITSARRYRHHGWLSTTARHLWLTWQLTRQARRRLGPA